ncbi:RHS repeat-associated core domain-containing protein [Luteimonas suaedae]|uniref:RHS repeat-associated core domain-containing protein n=1 Tax=Luteimonas suaedae TaxID=2605430 RepID=UPI0016594373|nr:RHS repeat-associated core domain-containing protein [Luteimonas suaedae]
MTTIASFALLAANAAFAQVYTHETYGQELDKTTRVQSLDHSGQFGEMVDLNSGAVSFRKTVVEVPGNNRLRVAIDYALNLKTSASNAPMYYWDRELPYIEGTHGKDSGWVVGIPGNYSNQRCSHSSAKLGAPVIRSTKPPINNFNREEYWNGNSLVVPGGEGGVIRPLDADESRPSGMDVHWATNSGWRFTCYQLPSGGEGFVGHNQNGDKLYFGAPVADTELFQIMNSFAPYNETWIDIVSYRMYLTRIEDRFGNWVKYEPHQVTSSDGRTITIERSGSNSIFKTGGRTWTVSGSNVLNPDGSSWSLARSGQFGWAGDQQAFGDTCRTAQSIPSIIGGGVTVTVTAESGAKGVFRVEPRRHGYSYVPYQCYRSMPPYGPEHSYPNQLYYMDQVSLVSRSVEGAGVQPYQEVIDYGQLNACYGSGSTTPPDQCQSNSPVTKTVTLTRSDGLVRRFVYGNKWGDNAGLLLSEQIGSAKRTDYSYAFFNDQIPRGSREYGKRQFFYNMHEYKLVRVKSTTITQQGTSFAYKVESFDSFARPTRITRSSNITSSPVRTDLIAYHDNLARWVLGQPSRLTVNGIVVSETGYSSYAQPLTFRLFGKLQWTRTYDVATAGQMGAIKTIKDGNNNVTTLTNWKRGIPQSVAYADGTTQSAVVNDAGSITRVTNENGFATNYAYDPMGRLSQIAYPTGDSTAWNATSFVFEQRAGSAYGLPGGHWRQVVSTGNGRKLTYFDALWRPVLVQEYDTGNVTATNRFTRYAYDHEGRTTFASYPVSSVSSLSAVTQGTHTSYDALGRTTTVRQNSELGDLVTAYSYLSNTSGYYTRITDPKGNQTRIFYQAFDQPSEDYPTVLASPGGRTDIVRDVFGKPKSITRSGGGVSATRSYLYDANQLLCKAVDPETRATILAYDGAGNLAWSKTGSGYTNVSNCNGDTVPAADRTVRTYDKRNRLKSVTYPDNLGNTTYSYTPDGLLAQVLADNGASNLVYNNYVYNKRRLLTGESMDWSNVSYGIGYGYNANGHLASHVYPGGVTVAYAPNALGQPTQAGTWATNVSYHPSGAIKQFTYGNGVVHTMTPNSRGLPERIRDAYSGATSPILPVDESYDYDGNGNVVAISDARTGQRGNRDMIYDGIDRLTRVDSSMFGMALYTYDALDNLRRVQVGTTAMRPARDHTYEYDAQNRLSRIANTAGGTAVTSLGYDLQGNIISRAGASYSFDFGNRLRSANQGGTVSSYVYDGHGRRVRDAVGGSKYSQYNRDGVLMFARNLRGATYTSQQYIHLGGRLIAIRTQDSDTGSVFNQYQHTDALGSVVARSSQGRTSVLYSEYEPYGALSNRANHDQPAYTGHVQDAATGLTYMQQRYYDPQLGVFLSVDPVTAHSNPISQFHRYRYANNNPYRFIDPDGRQSVGEMIDAGAEGCGPVSCAGWALLKGAWSTLGAEGVSQWYDKGWSSVDGGNRVGAGLEIAAVLPPLKLLGGARLLAKEGNTALGFSRPQLQHAFKHAVDFGVPGNASNSTMAELSTAIQRHVDSDSTIAIQGTYARGNLAVTHFVNPNTGLNVMKDASGNFLSGWRLSDQQLKHVLESGRLGGGK